MKKQNFKYKFSKLKQSTKIDGKRSREKKRKTEFLNLNWKLDKLNWKCYNSNFFIQISILNVKARKWRNPTEDN